MTETNFDVLNIEYMEDGEETFDYPEQMFVSVETREDDHYTYTKDSIRVKIKSYIRRNFGNDVEVVDFLAFPVGSNIELGQEFEAETFEAREKKIGSIRIVKNPNFPSGTSLQAYIKTNRAELRKVFGNPNMGESGDGKAKGKEWNLVVGGKRVTIYDYREKGKKGTKYFNIGGDGKYSALLVAQALSIHRNERVHAKEITPKWLEDERRHEMVQSIDDYPDLTYERAKEYEDNRRRYRAETFDVEFNEWAEQEMMSHGKDISFKDWAQDEGMKHGNVPITEWAEHEEESHDARYGAESFEDFKRKMVGDGAVAGDVGYMEALEEFYEDYLEDFERITDEFCPEPETFEEFQERVLKNDYEMSLEAEDWGGNPKGRLALALQKARENAKKPKKPLKIEKLDAEEWWDEINNEYDTHRGHSVKQNVGGRNEIWGTRDGEELFIFSQIPDYYTGTMYQKYPAHMEETYRESFLESLEQNKKMAKKRLMAEIEENIGKGIWTIEPYMEWFSRNKKWFLHDTWWGKTEGSFHKKTLIGSHAFYTKNWKDIQKTIDRHPTQRVSYFDKPNESGWVATTTLTDLEKPLDFVLKMSAETSGQWEIGEQLEEAQMNAETANDNDMTSKRWAVYHTTIPQEWLDANRRPSGGYPHHKPTMDIQNQFYGDERVAFDPQNYEKVATVRFNDGYDGSLLWRLTNNVDESWSRRFVLPNIFEWGTMMREKPLHTDEKGEEWGLRSSMVGDIFHDLENDEMLIIAPFGFEKIHNPQNKTFNAEGKKRKKLSGQLSDPFDELSLDSGDWKGIVAGFGIGLLALFGYSKLRK